MTEAISKRPLTQLNYEIEEAESELVKLEADRAAIAGMVSKASRRLRLLKLARWTRKPTVSLDLMPVAVLAVESGGAAILVFIVMLIAFGSYSLAFLGLLISFAVTAAILGLLLFNPSDDLLPAMISEAESHRHDHLQDEHDQRRDEERPQVGRRRQRRGSQALEHSTFAADDE